MGTVKIYSTGNVIRTLGINYLYEVLSNAGIDVKRHKWWIEFEKIDRDKFVKIFMELVFKVLKKGIKKELIEKEKAFTEKEFDELMIETFLMKIQERLPNKYKVYEKKFNGMRPPYVRNSSKFGSQTNMSLDVLKENIGCLFEVIQDNSYIEQYEVLESQCSICGQNHNTKKDINGKDRKTSKLVFIFTGAEQSGFNLNATVNNEICFECEFLNLMALLYISIEKPYKILGLSNLDDASHINKKLNRIGKNFTEKAFLKNLSILISEELVLYDVIIDTNKGIILSNMKMIDISWRRFEIDALNLIGGQNIRGTNKKEELIRAKVILGNKSIVMLYKWFEETLCSDSENFEEETSNNLNDYIDFIQLVNRFKKEKGEKCEYMSVNYLIKDIGSKLGTRMNQAEKKAFTYNIMRYKMNNNKAMITDMIMEKAVKYEILTNIPTHKIIYALEEEDRERYSLNIATLLSGVLYKEAMKNEEEKN